MRTLAVSLVGIVAIAVSLALVRQRQEQAPAPQEDVPARVPPAAGVDLDDIRGAGW
jgi:hypothetical protein